MGMDHRYGSCPLKGYGSWVWIMGYGSHVLPGYGPEPYILSRSHICSNVFYEVVRHGAAFVKVAHRSVGFSCGNALLRQFELRKSVELRPHFDGCFSMYFQLPGGHDSQSCLSVLQKSLTSFHIFSCHIFQLHLFP